MSQSTCVYMMGDGRLWKIGVADNPYRRMAQLQTACPFELQMYGFCYFPTRARARALERSMHASLAGDRLRGEWFDIEPAPVFAWLLQAEAREGAVAK